MSSPAATDAASSSSSAAALPVGFRFRPTDEELVRHYLKAKIEGRPHPDLLFIPDVDLSACEPWDLPAMSVIKSDDPEWFFFAARDRKYPGGHRSNRSTAAGYWKATGKDRLIRSSRPAGALIGIKKTLVFHRGRAPRGLRTAWIMHEYRTTEPQFESGLNGSFVLYRLFNKHEDETPGSNSDQQLHSASPPSTSTSSAGNHQNDTGVVQVQAAAISSIVKNETLPSDLSQMTAIRKATDDADQSMAHLPANVNNKQKTAAKEDAFLDVLTQLPDLQPEQRYSGFPIISSPMRPYSDNPCVGNLGEQDLSAYFDSIIAEQDLQDLLLSPTYAQMDKYPIGNIEPNPTAGAMLISSSNSKALLEDSWTTSDSNQHADATNATSCSSAINMQQTETGDANHEARAHTSMVYSDLPQGHHLGNHYQLQSMPYPLMESQMCGALCSAGSWTPYQQNLLNAMAEPSRSGMTTSDAFDAQGGWEPTPLMQQFTDPDFIDPQQGTAARRIRLVCSVQRASVSQPVLTSHLESEDEAESCNNTGISSKNHNEENVNAASRIVDGELTHIQREGDVLTQVDSLVEVTQDILPHAKLAPGTNLKQRIKLESAHTTKSDHLPGEPSPETIRQHQHAQGRSVVRLLWLSLIVLLVLVSVWKSLNY